MRKRSRSPSSRRRLCRIGDPAGVLGIGLGGLWSAPGSGTGWELISKKAVWPSAISWLVDRARSGPAGAGCGTSSRRRARCPRSARPGDGGVEGDALLGCAAAIEASASSSSSTQGLDRGRSGRRSRRRRSRALIPCASQCCEEVRQRLGSPARTTDSGPLMRGQRDLALAPGARSRLGRLGAGGDGDHRRLPGELGHRLAAQGDQRARVLQGERAGDDGRRRSRPGSGRRRRSGSTPRTRQSSARETITANRAGWTTSMRSRPRRPPRRAATSVSDQSTWGASAASQRLDRLGEAPASPRAARGPCRAHWEPWPGKTKASLGGGAACPGQSRVLRALGEGVQAGEQLRAVRADDHGPVLEGGAGGEQGVGDVEGSGRASRGGRRGARPPRASASGAFAESAQGIAPGGARRSSRLRLRPAAAPPRGSRGRWCR